MLVLTRKLGQQLVMRIGREEVILGILRISGGRVRVGIDAPSQVAVLRQELVSEGVSPRELAPLAASDLGQPMQRKEM